MRAYAALLCIIAGAIWTAVAVLTPIPEGGLAFRVLATAVILGLGSLLTFEAVTDRPPSVDHAGLSLPISVRRKDGTRTRRIAFSEVAEIEPKVVDGYNGLEISLADGVQTFLPQSAFGRRGSAVMDALCSRFGRNYSDEIARFLLEERDGQRFRVVRIRRVRGEYLIFRRGIPTFSGTTVRKVSREAIGLIRRVSTPYAGSAYLACLEDGTRFLLPEADAKSARLPRPEDPT